MCFLVFINEDSLSNNAIRSFGLNENVYNIS